MCMSNSLNLIEHTPICNNMTQNLRYIVLGHIYHVFRFLDIVYISINSWEIIFCWNKCSKSDAQIQTLENHQSKHKGEKKIQCTEYNYAFMNVSKSCNHICMVVSNYGYSISILFYLRNCGNRSIQKQTFAKHQCNHTGEKPFQCTKCNHDIIDKINSNTLMLMNNKENTNYQRIHTGEKLSFKCYLCLNAVCLHRVCVFTQLQMTYIPCSGRDFYDYSDNDKCGYKMSLKKL